MYFFLQFSALFACKKQRVPEWKFKGYFAPKDGAELYEVINGKEFLRAIYDEDVGRFVPIQ